MDLVVKLIIYFILCWDYEYVDLYLHTPNM
jgi:hypothetical protein